MICKDLNKHQIQAIKRIVRSLNDVQKSGGPRPGHLDDRMNIRRAVVVLNGLLDRYKVTS